VLTATLLMPNSLCIRLDLRYGTEIPRNFEDNASWCCCWSQVMSALTFWMQQQQQQHSIFSQASWGRLEMKPERYKFKVQACIIKLNICYDLVHWLSPKDRSPANSLFAWWELAGLGLLWFNSVRNTTSCWPTLYLVDCTLKAS